MSSELNRYFELNTAITAVTLAEGKFDEATHKKLVMPLRGLIMQHDGVTKCYIDRYGILVHFMDNVTTVEAVEVAVQDAVHEAARRPDTGEGVLFPHKGDKIPTVTLKQMQRFAPSNLRSIEVTFSSDLLEFPPSGLEGMDVEIFSGHTRQLVKQMTRLDGVRNYRLEIGWASLTYNVRIASDEAVKDHLESVFKGLPRAPFFPYNGGMPPALSFSEPFEVHS